MEIKLRHLPYPYKAAMAFCSDIDNSGDFQSVLDFQEFLCTSKNTKFGKGLNLEIGNSFWMFDSKGKIGNRYFKDLNGKISENTPIIRELIGSGYWDCLHSYGNFDNGGFNRKKAELVFEEFDKYNLRVPVWTNHGIAPNFQNVGHADWHKGSCENDKTNYHLDILKKIGVNFLWTGYLTHIIGQGFRLNHLLNLKKKIELLKNPEFTFNKNDLVFFDSSLGFYSFSRFINRLGGAGIVDFNELSRQIPISVIDILIKRQGSMILYTHFNENTNSNPKVLNIFKYISYKFIDELLLVCTTSRLLEYHILHRNIKYSVDNNNIYFDIPTKLNIDGLSFSIENGTQPINTFINDQDLSHRFDMAYSGGLVIYFIPWNKLEYPFK